MTRSGSGPTPLPLLLPRETTMIRGLSSSSLPPRSESIPAPKRETAVMPQTSAVRRKLSRMSPFRMWLNSCAITPCSSSRLSHSSAPRVTHTAADEGSVPAASALTPPSFSSTQTDGMSSPDAMDISSQTLRS